MILTFTQPTNVQDIKEGTAAKGDGGNKYVGESKGSKKGREGEKREEGRKRHTVAYTRFVAWKNVKQIVH